MSSGVKVTGDRSLNTSKIGRLAEIASESRRRRLQRVVIISPPLPSRHISRSYRQSRPHVGRFGVLRNAAVAEREISPMLLCRRPMSCALALRGGVVPALPDRMIRCTGRKLPSQKRCGEKIWRQDVRFSECVLGCLTKILIPN